MSGNQFPNGNWLFYHFTKTKPGRLGLSLLLVYNARPQAYPISCVICHVGKVLIRGSKLALKSAGLKLRRLFRRGRNSIPSGFKTYQLITGGWFALSFVTVVIMGGFWTWNHPLFSLVLLVCPILTPYLLTRFCTGSCAAIWTLWFASKSLSKLLWLSQFVLELVSDWPEFCYYRLFY